MVAGNVTDRTNHVNTLEHEFCILVADNLVVDAMGVGEKLRQFRKAKRMSQEELGRELNMTHAAVSKLETGKAKVDADLIPTLAALLQVSS